MKDRLLTFALAIGAFALFYVLMAPKPQPPQERPTRPVSTEQGPNGYQAMWRWFEAEGLKPVSLRERYGHLPELTARSATGNLLISTTPHIYPARDSEAALLRDWISDGNTLLVLAGLSDTPDWSMGEGIDSGFMEHMQAMTGLTFTQVQAEESDESDGGDESDAGDGSDEGQEEESDKSPEPERKRPRAQDLVAATTKLAQPLRFSMVPNDAHPLLEGVKSVAAISEFPTAQWRASSNMVDLVLELAQDPVSGEPVLWLARYGNGQIIVSAFGSVFTNKLLGESDNARLLANIVKWSRGAGHVPGGQIIIDDAHQGLVAFYDPDAFFGDQRLHHSLWWLVGLWLVFVLGPQRLRAAATGWNPVDVTSFVRASGGFMARVLKPATAGQQLFTNFFNDVRRQIGLPANGAPVWDWMTERSTFAPRDVEQLRELHGKILQGRRIDLPKLQNLLVQVRSNLT